MPTVITNDVPGTYSWTALSTTVQVECYGGGAVGGSSPGSGGTPFGGGGGGGYGLKTITGLTIGNSYSYHVADSGEDSWFINTSTVAGFGGVSGGQETDPRIGGAGGGWAGDSGDSGGGGGIGVDDPFASGAGGNGGGPLGGDGGASVGSGLDGDDGLPYGGGGSGSGGDVDTLGGFGASGMVRLTFTPATVPGGHYYRRHVAQL